MNDPIKAQFTILGMEGSGKTCYLLGAYNELTAGVEDFSFYTDRHTNVKLRTAFETLKNNNLSIKRFPLRTSILETYLFSMMYAYDLIIEFSWIDYPGGLLTKKEGNDENRYENLTEHILNSQVLFICLDGDLFIDRKNNHDMVNLIKYECSSVINTFFGYYSRANKYLPPIAILITKSDLCNKKFTTSDYEFIITKSFAPLFALVNNNAMNHFVSVIPVSLGNEISMNNYTGTFSPLNVETPIFMATWFTLKSSLHDIEKEQIKLSSNISTAERENFIKKINFSLEKLIRTLNRNIKLVYFNGNKYLYFQDAAEKYIERRINTNES